MKKDKNQDIKLSKNEVKRLNRAYSKYLNGRFQELSSFIVLMVGFCLGTLSAGGINPIFNFILIAFVLCIFVYLILKNKDDPDSDLKKLIVELSNHYKNKENNKTALNKIKSYDIWNGFSKRVVWSNLPLFFGVLFCIYTLAEHLLRVVNQG